MKFREKRVAPPGVVAGLTSMNDVRCRVILNPAARGGWVGRNLARIEGTLARHLNHPELLLTRHPGHAVDLARQAVDDGVELLVSVGGDGTHSQVANGVLMAGGAPADIALGIVHAGTGGDFRRMIPGASSLSSCCAVVRNGRPGPVDVIRATYINPEERSETRYAINMASLGLGADVVRWKQSVASSRFPSLQYLVGGLAALRQRQTRAVSVGIDDQDQGVFSSTVLCVCNGTHAGGGMRFSPEASISDGVLDVVVMEIGSLISALRIALSLYAGDVGARRQVRQLAGRRISVDGEPLALELDGEWVGRSPARFEVLPQALAVVGVPE